MKLSDFLTTIGRPIAFYPGLRKITGSTNATIFLCQFVYWTGKENSKDGWIYKTSNEIEEETGLSYDEQKTARAKLKQAGLIKERYARLEHQMYFKVVLDVLNEKWGNRQNGFPEHGITALAKAESQHSLNESKTTSETTTENKSDNSSGIKQQPLKEKRNQVTPKTIKSLDWMIAAGVPSEEIARLSKEEQDSKAITDHYEREMGYNPLAWSGNLERLKRFLLSKTPEEITAFAAWSKKPYSPLSPTQARKNPNLVIDCWPQSVTETEASSYRTL